MIEKAATHLANKIKDTNPDETSSVEVLTYGIAMSMNLIGVIAGCFIMGLVTGHIIDTFTAFAAFALLRRFSGGYHARSLSLCLVVSVVVFTVIPLIPVNNESLLIIKLICLLLVVVLAPANCTENNISEKLKIPFKVISILLTICLLLINSPIITLAVFSQAVLLIDIKWVKEVILK
ncbi:accessory gene regulator B family protein [Brevibacillus sp. HB1.4B]|uniref:accessory gene regulator B family protein n=1 Tax=Brevibacillus sp. HB1.4B TaxID=2738845 RepID=UPI00156ACC47|nr:accessory gene regulator B family protein [Brevibacillus sp. HB1.4B]NRS20564.1 accessory gene regulator B family protein [Brevibacillus sp. HB1.4B]